ncbi:proprotein convertase P-domain-containing protein [Pseudoalteromonas sp. B530]|uniref:proprotein convertase P-domain-containing protein n=1 Tax=Pseudoalteromonas sp. B530 TaxID=2994390 RepID=UPI00224AD486|nr:proprotein convertase P-domain-containing protein [Pseudoalteromonas sp. B530]MCX2767131.1 proprotein convertase P-domain-containing protein [Pseudoalteromonas sp. B530]
MKKPLLLLLLWHLGATAAELQFVTGRAINSQQAEQLLETKLARKYQFSYRRKGQFGNYYSFMPTYDALPIFNIVDSVATDQQGLAFRLYVSRFSTLNVDEGTVSVAPSIEQVGALIDKQVDHFSIEEIKRGWWLEQQGLRFVWNVLVSETLQGEVVTQHYFIDADATKILGQRGAIPAYQSEVEPEYSGRIKQSWLFDPDPKTSLMSEDIEQQFTPQTEFADAAFRLVELKDLTLIGNQLALTGPYARVTDFAEPHEVVEMLPVAGVAKNHHSSASFLQQMAYFHVDSAQRHLQELGFTGDKLIHYAPITIDAQGSYNDQSAYSFHQKRILLGVGGHADAQDADVIWHEYGHSVTNFINPYDDGADSGAIGEGYADFLAASHSYRDPQGYEFEPDVMFNWDARFGQRRPRTLNDSKARYNPNYHYPAHIHVAGSLGDQLWSTPLFQSFKEAEAHYGVKGMNDMEKIVIEAMFGLGAGITMPNLALSTLDMAKRLYPNEHYADILQQHFSHHNLLPKLLVIEQAKVIDTLTSDPSVVVNIKNISPYSLKDIQFASTEDSTIKIATQQVGDIKAGDSITHTFSITFDDAFELSCGMSAFVPVLEKYSTGIPVLNQSLQQLEVTLGQPNLFVVKGEGGVLKDATGEPSGVVHSKGITNFYLDVEQQSLQVSDDLKFELQLEHNDLSQVSIKLISPAGVAVVIWDQSYYPHSKFEFSLPSDVANVDFSPLEGQSFNGQWQLQVVDHKPDFSELINTPTLKAWQLSQVTDYHCHSASDDKEHTDDQDNHLEKINDNTSGSLYWLNIGLILIGLRRLKIHTRSKHDI